MARRSARLTIALSASTLVAGLVAALLVPQVTQAAPPAPAGDGTLDILVLGDSYSAGNGATDEAGASQTYGPEGCLRSRVSWGEKYAAALRAAGQPVRLVNHACSGGVTADITSPREMDTASRMEPTPAGVSTPAQADASLAQRDPCNTRTFPDEEFWTYHATSVTPLVVAYDCTRHLRAQADFVDSDVDLVLFTMGGNDAGFSSIVTSCFVPVTRSSSACKARVDAARALLPQIQQRLLADLDAIRAHGLREDARVVQLGYPWLQVDNDFTLPDPPRYGAGEQVRALVTDGNAAIAANVAAANVGHPGQLTFVGGVPQKFSGHEPDASTPLGNLDRWINQVGDGDAIEVFYHPNRLGHRAYAQLLLTKGTFGAPTSAGSPPSTAPSRVRADLRVRIRPKRVEVGEKLRVRIAVELSDGSRPRGRVVVRATPRNRRLATTRLRRSDKGTMTIRLRLRDDDISKLRFVYRDKVAPVVRTTRRVAVTR